MPDVNDSAVRKDQDIKKNFSERITEIHNIPKEDLPLLINGHSVEIDLMKDLLAGVNSTYAGSFENPIKVTVVDNVNDIERSVKAAPKPKYSHPEDLKDAKKTSLTYKDSSFKGPAQKKGL